ncbi:ribosome small subunit-dependent GTPase A [Methanofollis sp. W23]|uniref:ribosome small subunit-dependent GTPase A n=1 Tax=Methanofollis sp. W23 TaxID=2817849 RepID=UPI0032AF4E74
MVTAVGKNLDLRRIERYLTIVYSSGASPVIILNKINLAGDPHAVLKELESIAGDVPVCGVSALTKDGLDVLASSLSPNKTVALIGSSGVGKSTRVNAFFHATAQKTTDVREDDEKGRHTTTVRQLFVLPDGGIFIDNPGIREIQLGDSSNGVDKAFSDILEVARNCKFKDCTHRTEPHCVVREAVHQGVITEERVNSYHKLMDELAFQSERAEPGLKRLEKKNYKGMLQGARNYRKYVGK